MRFYISLASIVFLFSVSLLILDSRFFQEKFGWGERYRVAEQPDSVGCRKAEQMASAICIDVESRGKVAPMIAILDGVRVARCPGMVARAICSIN